VYSAYTMNRFQIYLDEGQHRQLAERAARRKTTVSAIIRHAIGVELDQPENEADKLTAWRTAVAETAGCAPYLPDGRTYLDEIRAGERLKRAAQ